MDKRHPSFENYPIAQPDFPSPVVRAEKYGRFD
jgi:hypothetical protein